MAFSAGHFAKQPYRPAPWDTGDNKTLDELLSTERWELDFGINGYPRYLLDFPSLGSEIPDAVRSGWGRNTAGRFVNSNGLYESAASDVPRLQYPFGSGNPSLLVEAAGRTNHWKQSSDISQWKTQGASVGASKTSILNGETAYAASASSSGDYMEQNSGIGTASNGEAVLWCIVEKIDSDKIGIGVEERNNFNKIGFATYEFSTDTANASTGIEANARVLTSSGPNGGEVVLLVVRYDESDDSGAVLYGQFYPDRNGNGNSAIGHHFQREEAPNASSPIVTGASATTRAADDYTIFSGGQPDWWNPNEGTFFIELTPRFFYSIGFNKTILGTGQSEDRWIQLNPGGSSSFQVVTRDSTYQVNPSNKLAPFQRSKIAVSVTSSEMKLSVDGVTETDNHDGGLLDANKIDLFGGAGISPSSFTTRRVIYFPRALSESTLNTLTS